MASKPNGSYRADFLDQPLPASNESEKAVLGAILLENRLVNQAATLLKRDDFFLYSHRCLYEKMVTLSEKQVPIDLITLGDILRDAGEFEQVGGATYIASLIDGVPRTDTIEHHAKLIKEKAQLRRLISLCNNTISRALEAEEPADDLIELADEEIRAIADDSTVGGFRRLGDGLLESLDHVEQMRARPEMITGVPTGLTDVDMMLNGLQRQDSVILAARPSQGKTSLALNIGLYAAKQGAVVGMFSLEMGFQPLIHRVLSSECRIDGQRLRTGYLNREEVGKLADGARRINDLAFWIDDRASQSILQMRAKARRLKATWNLDLLIVDYLTLIAGDSRRTDNRVVEVGRISKGLKAMAKELDVPVLTLSQLTRATEHRADRRPQLSDLRDSGDIEADADVVLGLYREEMYNASEENRGQAELIVLKQRNGPTGTVDLAFIKEFSRFENMWRG